MNSEGQNKIVEKKEKKIRLKITKYTKVSVGVVLQSTLLLTRFMSEF